MAFDLEATIDLALKVSEEIDKLVTRAVDHRGQTIEERRNAAMAACERIHMSGVLPKLREAQTWIKANRVHFTRALSLGSFLNSFRGR
jgi:hypothetical protein